MSKLNFCLRNVGQQELLAMYCSQISVYMRVKDRREIIQVKHQGEKKKERSNNFKHFLIILFLSLNLLRGVALIF